MSRSSREVFGGLAVLLCCAVIYIGLRFALSYAERESSSPTTEAERHAIEVFEHDRYTYAIRQQAYRDSIRHQYDTRRAQRQKAYADSQRVWAERRQQWASEKAERAARRAARQAHYDSLRALRPQKLPQGSVVDANAADTTLLKRIPGIGSYLASKITAYRSRLGGFVSAAQLDEIEGLPHGISSWFIVSTLDGNLNIRRINVNRADFKELIRHPYLDKAQTNAILDLRRRTGRIRGWDDLKGCGLFGERDISRLSPYIVF